MGKAMHLNSLLLCFNPEMEKKKTHLHEKKLLGLLT